MNLPHIVQSKYFRGSVFIVGIFLVALASFVAGIAVGIHKAKFSYAWGENYERNFTGNNQSFRREEGKGMMERFEEWGKFEGRDFRNGHGTAGEVLSISEKSIVVKNKENQENIIAVSDGTVITRGGKQMMFQDVLVGDSIVVLGKPGDNGMVNADFIRVFPPKNVNK